MHEDQIAEIQGLYGPFTLSERVIQKIWLRQDFALTSLKTVSGKTLIIKDPGRWNVYEGPDFKEARLILDGVEQVGDVEIHLNLLDWHYHQHEYDVNYDRVLLHVVLHLNRTDQASQVQTSKGCTPELLNLLPLLNQDLESYAMEDALLELEKRDELEWVAQFVHRPMVERLQILKRRSLIRWQQKLVYAKQRLKTEGWEAACHSYALEVLGYKRNRAPMLKLAAQYPLEQMRLGNFGCRKLSVKHPMVHLNRVGNLGDLEDAILVADRLFNEEATHWKLNGLRPANHPRRRLIQYLTIVAKQPNWPGRLADCIQNFPAVGAENETRAFRKAIGLPKLCSELKESVFCSVIGEKRFNTLVVDAILPLATAAGLLDGLEYWLHWFLGDSPDALRHFLRQAVVINRQNPLCNGLNQGALALFFDRGIEREKAGPNTVEKTDSGCH